MSLVDICVSSSGWIGTKALWQPENLRELFVAFSEPDAVGLSSIAGLIHPVSRWAPYGLHLTLCPPETGAMTVMAPIAPGLLAPVGVASITEIHPGRHATIQGSGGTIALDGEREIEFSERDRLNIWLQTDGPVIVDVSKAMDRAVRNHVFVDFPGAG
jgi:hypothetical protein